MKQLLLVLSLAICSLTINAQTFKKSDKFVEGSISYSKDKGSDAVFSIAPTVGYFVSDKVALGVFGEVGTNEDAEDIVGVGAFMRYYFLEIGKNFKGFTNFSLGNTTVKNGADKASEFSINGGIGANYFISNKVALTAHISDLLHYSSSEGTSSFAIGFQGFNNPLATTNFGILIKL